MREKMKKIFKKAISQFFGRQKLPLPLAIALSNLVSDKGKFFATIMAVAFSVILAGLQLGILKGFMSSTSTLIDRPLANLWVMAPGTSNINQSFPFQQKLYYSLNKHKNIVESEKLIVSLEPFHKKDGTIEYVVLVGIDPYNNFGTPWNVDPEAKRLLRLKDTFIMDEFYKDQLVISGIGDWSEINNIRARAVGFTTGIKTFTQTPIIFTSYENALRYTGLSDEQTNYALLSVTPGSEEKVIEELTRQFPEVEIVKKADFSWRTQVYWMLKTGAGTALLMTAFIGVLVGIVVVSQVLYGLTVNHRHEYATLLTLGAPRNYVLSIVIYQSAILCGLGLIIGAIAILWAHYLSIFTHLTIEVDFFLYGFVFLTTVCTAFIAAVSSIRELKRIDPVTIFKRGQ